MNLENQKNNASENINPSDFDDVDIKQILYSIKRRKRFIISVSSFIFILICLFTGYKRILKPTYIGSFKLLITDPLSDKSDNKPEGIGVFETVARNTTNNDIPTLREFLKSPLVIDEVGRSTNVSTSYIISNLSINTLGKRDNVSKGVLEVSLKSRKKKEGLKILKSLSNAYLELALVQKQKRNI